MVLNPISPRADGVQRADGKVVLNAWWQEEQGVWTGLLPEWEHACALAPSIAFRPLQFLEYQVLVGVQRRIT
jgi:hypothetical protein